MTDTMTSQNIDLSPWDILYISTLHCCQEGQSNIGTPRNGFVFRTEGCLSFSSRGRKTRLSQSTEFLSLDAQGRISSQNQEPRLTASIYWLCTTELSMIVVC